MIKTNKYLTLDENNEVVECDPFEWSDTFFKNPRHVGRTDVGGYHVSTMFDGFGNMWDSTKHTIIFETTVYKDRIKYTEFTTEYDTWDEAEVGHAEVVNQVKLLVN